MMWYQRRYFILSQYDKTNDSIVKNWKTKAHSKIVWKIKRKTLTQIGSESLKKNMANRKKSGSFRINCIVSIKSGKLKLCSFYVQYFIMSHYDKTELYFGQSEEKKEEKIPT